MTNKFTDEYGVVINSSDTYKKLATELNFFDTVFFAWTDELGTQFDILIVTLKAPFLKIGPTQGGLGWNDLFVSIMQRGAFAFDIRHTDTHPSYYNEKLNIGSMATAEKIADLINGIKKELDENNSR